MFVQFIVCHTRVEWECIYPLSCNANCIQRIIVKMSFWCENKNIIIRIIFLVFLFSTEKGMLFYCCTLLLRNVFLWRFILGMLQDQPQRGGELPRAVLGGGGHLHHFWSDWKPIKPFIRASPGIGNLKITFARPNPKSIFCHSHFGFHVDVEEIHDLGMWSFDWRLSNSTYSIFCLVV